MEACATSHPWGRVARRHAYEERLVPTIYVKPFVKGQKNDRADAAAMAEAAARPALRFVAVKSQEIQGRVVAFRTRQCLVRQRTGSSTRFGDICPKGLETALADETSELPGPVRERGSSYPERIAGLTEVVERISDELEKASGTDAALRRLRTIPGIGPGIGPVTVGAVAAFAPDLGAFDSGRDFAAWLGLVPGGGPRVARSSWDRSARWGEPTSAGG